MLGMMNGAQGFVIAILLLLSWIVPIAIVVWCVRTLSAIAKAQREIVARLASIDARLHAAFPPLVS